ncbi:MAG: site-2 protease family protein [Sulfolobales archaeon]
MKEEVESILTRYASVELTYEAPSFLEYIVTSGSIERHFSDVFRELVRLGYQPLLVVQSGHEVLRVFRVGVSEVKRVTYYGLTLATVAAVIATGYFNALSFYECLGANSGGILLSVLAFTLSILIPLALHEIGHFVTSRATGVPTPLPLFIPAPIVSPLGTFGAVITTRFLPQDRKSLALLGISGPLVGVTASLLALMITLRISPAVKLEELACPDVSPIGFVPLSMYIMLTSGFIPQAEGTVILLHPAALASMLLLLIHFANLLPIGQLDGGHVVRSLISMELHRIVSMVVPAFLVMLSLFIPAYRWLGFFSVLAILISGFRPHIGYSNQASKLSTREGVLLLTIYLLLLLATIPVPL